MYVPALPRRPTDTCPSPRNYNICPTSFAFYYAKLRSYILDYSSWQIRVQQHVLMHTSEPEIKAVAVAFALD